MTLLLRLIQALALLYNVWIIARVLYDWGGILLAVIGVMLTPMSVVVMPVAMFFIPSTAAGPFALWPGILVVGGAESLIRKIVMKGDA